jgi:hypothetical protein
MVIATVKLNSWGTNLLKMESTRLYLKILFTIYYCLHHSNFWSLCITVLPLSMSDTDMIRVALWMTTHVSDSDNDWNIFKSIPGKFHQCSVVLSCSLYKMVYIYFFAWCSAKVQVAPASNIHQAASCWCPLYSAHLLATCPLHLDSSSPIVPEQKV